MASESWRSNINKSEHSVSVDLNQSMRVLQPGVVLVLQEVVELGDVGDDAKLVRDVSVQHVLWVEEAGNAELLLSHPVGEGVVPQHVLPAQAGELDELRPEVVDEGAEGEPVPPAGVHVDDVDILVGVRHPTTPDLRKTFL